ncbi:MULTISPECIES: hypothetical protein [Halorussus]|uniref:hypothetical protein n=1 Tax=Halorussus TaxID=1070314 RepID=UPI00209CA504|nr:hypothetical protein [Halorussus vallis]USZ76004.1 hypothetical protein NGM07_01465 [Halorussus vallis]
MNKHSRHGNDESEPHDRTRGYGPAEHATLGGLTVASDGLRLEPDFTRVDSGVELEWTYQIHGEQGVVTEFEETHDQLAHLILVRRDLTRFQHLHPKLDQDGAWSAEFTLPNPGVYRAFVDVLVDGQPTTLGVDLLASGNAEYEPNPGSTHEATVEGYDVTLDPVSVFPGERTTLEFEVRRDGERVRLDPYLGALGHLVSLRDGDLAYLHVHPEETDPADGNVRFAVQFPTSGRYRLFIQAKPRGELITASFDVISGNCE